jgi:hypothetical protein
MYDIHGNIPALEEVLPQAHAEGVDRWLLGGDYGTPSPWPLDTLARLRELENATWIRGNGERWLREPPLDRPEVMEVYDVFTGGLPDDVVEWLYGLPPQADLDGVLYVHGSPLPTSKRPEPPRRSPSQVVCALRSIAILASLSVGWALNLPAGASAPVAPAPAGGP